MVVELKHGFRPLEDTCSQINTQPGVPAHANPPGGWMYLIAINWKLKLTRNPELDEKCYFNHTNKINYWLEFTVLFKTTVSVFTFLCTLNLLVLSGISVYSLV